MSRIGKKPVSVPANVKLSLSGQTVSVEGPVGKLSCTLRPEIVPAFDQNSRQVTFARSGETRQARALHGLSRALVQNMVKGVAEGYEKKLEVVGVGYLFAIQKGVLQMRVGFANEVQKPIPAGLEVKCPDQTHLVIRGADKQLVGQFAAEVRAVRKPEPYKGKGIRYDGEVVRRKAGKAMSK